jgi:hypothetical protein
VDQTARGVINCELQESSNAQGLEMPFRCGNFLERISRPLGKHSDRSPGYLLAQVTIHSGKCHRKGLVARPIYGVRSRSVTSAPQRA